MSRFFAALAVCVLLVPAAQAATVTVGDSSAPWAGFMTVFEQTANGDASTFGGQVFGSNWGVADLVATFDDGAPSVTLSPNTIGDPNEFWYQNTSGTAPDPVNPGGPGQLGNKHMEANLFIGDDSLVGDTVTFEGEVLSNTFTAAHSTTIFIRDFAPDFSSFIETTAPATPGPFSITLVTTTGDPGRHIQYGFATSGENVWVTDTASFGSVVIGPAAAAVPEPTSMILVGLGLMGMAAGSRRS